jgi:hypothetical protein
VATDFAGPFKAKNQKKWPNIGKNQRNPQENCGNRAFLVDFAHLKAAL